MILDVPTQVPLDEDEESSGVDVSLIDAGANAHFTNPNQSCWFSTLLQCMVTPYHQWAKRNIDSKSDPDRELAVILSRLPKGGDMVFPALELPNLLNRVSEARNWDDVRVIGEHVQSDQHDVHEFFLMLNRIAQKSFEDVTSIYKLTRSECTACRGYNTKITADCYLQVPMHGDGRLDLQDMLDASGDWRAAADDYTCTRRGCSLFNQEKQSKVRIRELLAIAENLTVVVLDRFGDDDGQVNRQKNMARVFMEATHDFKQYDHVGEQVSCVWRKDVTGVLIHDGSTLNSGHYTAYVRAFDDESWWYYDDKRKEVHAHCLAHSVPDNRPLCIHLPACF